MTQMLVYYDTSWPYNAMTHILIYYDPMYWVFIITLYFVRMKQEGSITRCFRVQFYSTTNSGVHRDSKKYQQADIYKTWSIKWELQDLNIV